MNSFLRFFWLACISGLVGCRSDHSYTHESATLFDAARLIGADQSDEPHLLRLFERFADTECGGRRLARLTVSADDNDLEAALNVYFPEADPTKAIRAGFVSLDVGRPGLAQAWCLDDQATVIIKRKDGVLRHQIRGDHDARSLTLNGYAMTLVGVRLSPTIQPSMVSLFAVGSDLPDVGVAESIHAAVERKVGSGTFLYLRTDPMFAQYDGPSWDIFATLPPKRSPVAFLGRPHIVCSPNSTGGRCLLVTSPPQQAAEDWGRPLPKFTRERARPGDPSHDH